MSNILMIADPNLLDLDSTFKRLTIYKKEDCFPCKMTVKKLVETFGFKEDGIETFMIDDPEDGEEITEYIKTLFNVSSAPLVLVKTICKNTGDILSITHWTGFNPSALKEEVEEQLEYFVGLKPKEEAEDADSKVKEKDTDSKPKTKPKSVNITKKLFIYTSGKETNEQIKFASELQEEVGDLLKVKLIDSELVGYYENFYGESFVVVVEQKNEDTKATTIKFATTNFEQFLSENFYLDFENFQKHQ